jgi:hypothetical protein
VQKRGGASETSVCQTCGRGLATHSNEHRDAKYFVTSVYGSLPATSVIPTGVEACRLSSSKSILLSE